jgi:hypothetical protein
MNAQEGAALKKGSLATLSFQRSRRAFGKLAGTLLLAALVPQPPLSNRPFPPKLLQGNWQDLLPDYAQAARNNIVAGNNRRALLSAYVYPGTYIRDALFWGPLALDDAALGFECYQWFAETQLPTGQIRTAVPLIPDARSCLSWLRTG